MAANDVVVRMSAENADMVRGWLEAQRGPAAFSQELDKIAVKGRNAGRATKEAFANAGGEAMKMVGALTGLGSTLAVVMQVASTIKAEYEAWLARRKESADAQVGIYEAHMRATKAINGEMNPDQVFQRVVSQANGVDPKDLLLTIESGISASGDVSKEDVIAMVLASAKAAPEMALQRRQALVTGSLMTMKGFPNFTPQQAIAATEQSFIAARTEDVTDFAKNMAPGIANLVPFGSGKDSHQYLTSMAIAMGQRSGDATGRRSMNALITMLKQVKEETISAGLVKPDASVEEQIEAVRGNKDLQEKLLGVFAQGELGEDWQAKLNKMRMNQKKRGGDLGGEISGEAKSFIAITEMLSPGDNPTKKEFESAMGKIALPEEAVKQTQASRKAVAGSRAGQPGEMARLTKQIDNRDLLLDPAGRQEATLALNQKILQAAGWGAADRWGFGQLDRTATWLNPEGNGLERSEEMARAKAAELRKFGSAGALGASGAHYGSGPTEEGNRRAENLEAIAEEIRGLREDMKTAKDQPQKVELQRDGAGQPLPAAPGIVDRRNGGASGSW